MKARSKDGRIGGKHGNRVRRDFRDIPDAAFPGTAISCAPVIMERNRGAGKASKASKLRVR